MARCGREQEMNAHHSASRPRKQHKDWKNNVTRSALCPLGQRWECNSAGAPYFSSATVMLPVVDSPVYTLHALASSLD